jgi:hypothetical protein
VAVGLVGLLWLAVCARHARSAGTPLVLTGLAFAAVIGFNLFYGIGDIYVFYIPAYLIWVLWMAAGVWAFGRGVLWLCARANERVRIRGTRGGRGGAGRALLISLSPCLLFLLIPAWLLADRLPHVDRSHDNSAQTTWQALLAQPIEPNAVLVTNDRDEMVPQWYLKYVTGQRADVAGLFPLIQPGPDWADVGQTAAQALRSGRPVYLIKPMPGLEVKFRLEPVRGTTGETGIGSLVRVLGPAATEEPDRLTGAVFGERIRLVGYDAEPAVIVPGGVVAIALIWQPIQEMPASYTTFVHLIASDGAVVGQSDHRPGGVYYPTELWRPGDLLRDEHRIAVATDAGAGPFALEIGLYILDGELRHLGSPLRVGELTAGRP